MDLRRTLPGFPPTYFGCAVALANATIEREHLAGATLADLARRVRDAVAGVDEAAARRALAAIDRLRRQEGLAALERLHVVHPRAGLLVTNLSRLPVREIVFDAGPPVAFDILAPAERCAVVLPAEDGLDVRSACPRSALERAGRCVCYRQTGPVASLARLVREPIDVAALAGADAGATARVCLFVGVVRNENQGRAVLRLEYEAYEEMALPLLEEIAEETRRLYPVTDVRLVHRLGRLEIGEASVAVAVSSPHRAEAFAACRFAIDTLKAKVPIWKKELYADGSAWLDGS